MSEGAQATIQWPPSVWRSPRCPWYRHTPSPARVRAAEKSGRDPLTVPRRRSAWVTWRSLVTCWRSATARSGAPVRPAADWRFPFDQSERKALAVDPPEEPEEQPASRPAAAARAHTRAAADRRGTAADPTSGGTAGPTRPLGVIDQFHIASKPGTAPVHGDANFDQMWNARSLPGCRLGSHGGEEHAHL